MKKLTVRDLVVMIVSLSMVQAMAASASIGIVTAKGSFRVDDSSVAGNATLFEGAAVETGSSTGELNLSRAKVAMAAETRGRVYQDRLVLDRGKVQWTGTGFRTVAGELQVIGATGASKALVVRNGATIQVASLAGSVNVLSATGEPLMTVASGNAYEFGPEQEPQGASPGDKGDPKAEPKCRCAPWQRSTGTEDPKNKRKCKCAAVPLSLGSKVGLALLGATAIALPAAVIASRDDSSTVSR